MGRLKSGIEGFDEIIGGGYPEGTNVLITGASGTGKTVFCAQFIYRGIAEYNEPGIYVTLEERPEDLRKEMLSLGWDIKKFEDEEKLIIIDAASTRSGLHTTERYTMPKGFDIDSLVTEIYRATKKINAKRVVIDSIPALELRITDPSQIRKTIFRLSSLLLEIGVTSLITTESITDDRLSRYGLEEFVSRGVIVLKLEEKGLDLKRSFRVRKMRETKHTMRSIPFEIQKEKGIVIYWAGVSEP
ncbi:MAG: ATPase domain-containing protein [Candidatus Methanofastidiosia archaeon]